MEENMKTIIYYFTGTGNSLLVAKKIAEKIEGAELRSVVKAINDTSEIKAEKVGIVFPVYAFRPPHIIMKFLKKLNENKNVGYTFLIAVNGGGAGDLYRVMKRKFRKCNLKAMFGVKMIQNYMPFFDIIPEEQQKERFKIADEKINEIVDVVKNDRTHFDISDTKFFITYINPGLMYKLAYPMIPKMDKSFWVNDKCDGCGICEKVCPVNNLKMNNGKPEWSHNCEQCVACLHWCPKSAIQVGKNTESKGRYHHPEIKINEIIAQKK